MDSKSEIILYQPDNEVRLEVRLEDETVWLNRQQLSALFDRDIKTIGKHINNALSEELQGISVVAKFATTAADGKTYQVEYYNLDMVLSIGYRVNWIWNGTTANIRLSASIPTAKATTVS